MIKEDSFVAKALLFVSRILFSGDMQKWGTVICTAIFGTTIVGVPDEVIVSLAGLVNTNLGEGAKSKIFIYMDAHGNITAREVTNISETEDHIQCICLTAEALRTFRKDRILEYLENQEQISERIAYHIANNPEPATKRNTTKRNTNTTGSLEVCFTGFNKADKEQLTALAESKNMYIRTSVTTNLHFLCCGYNAGPSKIEKSRHQGVIVLTENQFRLMLETGEIPEES